MMIKALNKASVLFCRFFPKERHFFSLFVALVCSLKNFENPKHYTLNKSHSLSFFGKNRGLLDTLIHSIVSTI